MGMGLTNHPPSTCAFWKPALAASAIVVVAASVYCQCCSSPRQLRGRLGRRRPTVASAQTPAEAAETTAAESHLVPWPLRERPPDLASWRALGGGEKSVPRLPVQPGQISNPAKMPDFNRRSKVEPGALACVELMVELVR